MLVIALISYGVQQRESSSNQDPVEVEVEVVKKVKKTYGEIKKVMDSEKNDEEKKTEIQKILFESFASQDGNIITNQQRFDALMRLEVDSGNPSDQENQKVQFCQKMNEIFCCIKNQPEFQAEFQDKKILQLMQDYYEAVVEAEDYSSFR